MSPNILFNLRFSNIFSHCCFLFSKVSETRWLRFARPRPFFPGLSPGKGLTTRVTHLLTCLNLLSFLSIHYFDVSKHTPPPFFINPKRSSCPDSFFNPASLNSHPGMTQNMPFGRRARQTVTKGKLKICKHQMFHRAFFS